MTVTRTEPAAGIPLVAMSSVGRQLLRAAVAGVAVTALVLSGSTAGHAHPGDREDGAAELLAVLQRDLGLASPEEAEQLLTAADAANKLDAELRIELGDAYVGSRFDGRSGRLIVAISDPKVGKLARERGARTRVVRNDQDDLAQVVAGIQEKVAGGGSGINEWYADPLANRVVVVVEEGANRAAGALTDEYGDLVTVEESDSVPELANHSPDQFLDGGLRYTSGGFVCSTGFNMEDPYSGTGYVLTAGHCITEGHTVVSHSRQVGQVVHSSFGDPDALIPYADYGLIEVTNTTAWEQGPFVWTYPSFTTVAEFRSSVVGTPVCKSGQTTGLTCGAITALDVGVVVTDTQGGSRIINGLVRHNACMEEGDSGGPAFSGTPSSHSWIFAEGVNSSYRSVPGSSPRCLETIGQENSSTFYPLYWPLMHYFWYMSNISLMTDPNWS